MLILVVVHERVEEIGLAELLLRLLPRRRFLEHRHHSLQAELDHGGRLGVGFHLGHVLLGEHVERRGGGFQRGHSLREPTFTLRRDGVRLLGFLADLLRVRLDQPFLLVGRALVLHDDHQELLAIHLCLRHRHPLLLGDDGHLLNLHAGLVQLGQAPAELIAFTADLLRLLEEQRAVAAHKLEVIRGRDVIFTLERREHLCRFLRRGRVDQGKHRAEVVLHLLAHALLLLHLFHGNLAERVRGPLGEPIDRAAVDETREHPTPLAETLADWRHAEHDVQIPDNPAQKVRVQLVLGVCLDAVLLGAGADVLAHATELILGEQVRHLARGEDVVDILEERLDDDLRLVEKEHRGLIRDARLLEQGLEVLPELGLPVVLGDFDAEALQVGDVRRQPGEGLATRAADADQERVSPRLHQHAVDAAHVQ